MHFYHLYTDKRVEILISSDKNIQFDHTECSGHPIKMLYTFSDSRAWDQVADIVYDDITR